MIQLNRNYTLPEREDDIIPIKVIGIGGAGSNVLDRVVLDGMDQADLIAANTDVQSLASSVAAAKVQLGRSITRGLADLASYALRYMHRFVFTRRIGMRPPSGIGRFGNRRAAKIRE